MSRYADRDRRIASRNGMGWEDAYTPFARALVKRSTRRERRAGERQMRVNLLRRGSDE